MPRPHPPEFRRRAVELANQRGPDGERLQPVAKTAEDLGISESCLRNWMAQAGIDAGARPGLSTEERRELDTTRAAATATAACSAPPTTKPPTRPPPTRHDHLTQPVRPTGGSSNGPLPRLWTSDSSRARTLGRWLHRYNHHRHHTAIGGPPIRRVTNQPGRNS
jgi:transposase-like protein